MASVYVVLATDECTRDRYVAAAFRGTTDGKKRAQEYARSIMFEAESNGATPAATLGIAGIKIQEVQLWE